MTTLDEAALRRNTFPNNSTSSITVTGSPNLFGPDVVTCQRCGKPFEPRQGRRQSTALLLSRMRVPEVQRRATPQTTIEAILIASASAD